MAAVPHPSTLDAFIAGRVVEASGPTLRLVSPNDLSEYGSLRETPEALIGQAVEDAHRAYREHRRASTAERARWLEGMAAAIEGAQDELLALLISDIGKPHKAAKFEALRSAAFLRACAAQLVSLGVETLSPDSAAAGAGRLGITRRVPYGVVAAISPFNAPINLLCQKVGPALAVGNAVVVKPHPAGTRVALRAAELFIAGGLPKGLCNIVTGDRDAARLLVAHPKVMAVSFTGGTAAGDALVRAAGAKKFVAELGSNAANVVLADADVADAAKRIAAAAFEASGQQCISAQRVIVEAPVYDAFVSAFVAAAKELKVGAAADPATAVGPMVSLAAAKRVMGMVAAAVAAGAKCALEPRQQDCLVSPGILVDVPRTASMWCDEAFGPVALVQRAANADEALELANDSPFGLQGAVFTRSLESALRFSEDFEVGSLWVNEASRFRLDMYPFGGMKRSGFGREGVRYAMEELSQLKFTGLRFQLGKP
jgi:acyl-CoA reductase-like NAD-dependent aldehyde dehydrogenase